jgi:ribosome-associated protein
MAKATKGRKPAKGKAAGGKAAGGKAGARRPARAARGGKGKAPAKRFFVGKAPRPAEGRKAAASKGERKGLKQAALRSGKGASAVQAPVVPPPAPPVPELPDEGRDRALAAVKAGAEKKAEIPVVLDVRGLSGVADYFVLLTADSDRQAAAVADAVDEALSGLGAQRLGAEGRSGGGWVLLDFGDVVVHVMSPESRGFYDLEGLWADAKRVPVQA